MSVSLSDPAGPDLQGRTVVITGASSGIGAAAARRFAALGATVAVVGRSPQKTREVAEAIGAEAHIADFARLDDVRALADELLARYPRIDVLANNAGGVFSRRTVTEDGNELTFQVNHLAPFLLTTLLLDRLTEAPQARVITTGSVLYRHARIDLDDLDSARIRYRSLRAYGIAKLGTVLFTRELARRTRDTGVTASAFHPGEVASDISRDSVFGRLVRTRLARAVLATPDKGAEPLLHLATEPDPGPANGVYFDRLRPEEPKNLQATDAELAERLWERSARLTGVAAG